MRGLRSGSCWQHAAAISLNVPISVTGTSLMDGSITCVPLRDVVTQGQTLRQPSSAQSCLSSRFLFGSMQRSRACVFSSTAAPAGWLPGRGA